MKLKLWIGIFVLLLTFPSVLGGLFTPESPPPMIGPQGPVGPQGPKGDPGNYTIGEGLILINGSTLTVNQTLLNMLYNDTYLILFVNSSLSNRIDYIENETNDLWINVSNLETDVFIAQFDINQLQSDVNDLEGDVNDLQSDVSNLQNSLNNYYNKTESDNRYYSINNPNNYINSTDLDNITNGTWVQVTGDTMTGDLNMSNHSIWEVDILSVHNITGRSPIYVNSPIISAQEITAQTFYGNIQGQNGTIYGVTITNGTISNLHVSDNAIFNTSLVPELNNTWSLGEPDKVWKNFYVVDLVAANITSPDIDNLYNITNNLYYELDNKLNVTDQRYNETGIIILLNQTLYISLTNEQNARIGNDTYLQEQINNTQINISNINIILYNLNITLYDEINARINNDTYLQSQINDKLNITDQRYNETVLILAVNVTLYDEINARIGNDTFLQSQIDLKLNVTDQRYNETVLILGVNSTVWNELNQKLNVTDQRYNDTTYINYILTNYYNQTQMDLYLEGKLNVTDQRYNETQFIIDYFDQILNTTSNVTFNRINLTDDLNMQNNDILNVLRFRYNITSCDASNEPEGTTCWNADQKTLDIARGNGQVIQVGKELGDDGINKDNVSLVDGNVVYMSGITGDNPEFKRADGTNISKSSFVGVLTIPCNPNNLCPVTVFGFVNNVDTSMWNPGDKLYIDPVNPGQLTNIVPTLPNNPLWIATAVRISSTVGNIFVNPQIDQSDGFLINSIYATGNITADKLFANINASYIENPPWLTNYTETDPLFTAENSSIWNAINNKLNVSDQRYNETIYINMQLLNYYNITQIDSFLNDKLNTTDQRYNDTVYINMLLLDYYNITQIDSFLNDKLNTTDQRYNETELINNVSASIKQPYGEYLPYNSTNFWVNETLLNKTINNISKVRKIVYNISCLTVNGTCSVISNNITHLITEIVIMPSSISTTYRFNLTEYPNINNVIDADRKQHVDIWDIEKNYAINSQVEANIYNSNNDELFNINIIYLTNGVE